MNTEKWQTIKALFNQTSELEPAKQAVFLADNTDDKEIINQVLLMLNADNPDIAKADGAINLTNIVARGAGALGDSSLDLLPGDKIEKFTVDACIGEGGMGKVFLAHRTEPDFTQQVAIKIIHKKHLSLESELRFKQERQILASLQHNNIASLIGGGETENGNLYIILEYVNGLPINDYCEQHQLTVEQRLSLFNQVLAATDYAHQNLVVHRDIKPSNVLVTDTGDVKLLDFGIAKLISEKPNQLPSDLTQEQMRILTPGNASPEQVLGAQITTRSDVYGLGTLLMHLLTDEAVFAHSNDVREVESFILEKTPTKPSIKCRHASNKAIQARAKILKGDLDVIVMKALQKSPERRYSSVMQFAEDIQRYNNHYPISAKPDSLMYKTKKYLQRNTASSIIGVVFVLSLMISSAVIFQQSEQIKQERDRALAQAQVAQQTADFMLKVFESADPYKNDGIDIPASELLASAVTELQQIDKNDQVKAQLLASLASVYSSLEDFTTARTLINQALDVVQQIKQNQGDISAQTDLSISRTNGSILLFTDDFKASTRLFSELLVRVQQPEFSSQFSAEQQVKNEAILLYELATTLSYQDDDKSAAKHYKTAIELLENAALEVDNMAAYYASYAHALRGSAEFYSSEIAIRKAINLERKKNRPTLDLGHSLNQLASTLITLGRLEEALQAAKEGLAVRAAIVDEQHVEVLASQGIIARVYYYMQRFEEALSVHQTRLKAIKEVYGTEHRYYAGTLVVLGNIYLETSQIALAQQHFSKAHDIFQRIKPNHYAVASPLIGLGRTALKQNAPKEALVHLKQALDIMNKSNMQEHRYNAEAMGYYGVAWQQFGEQEKGQSFKQQALAMYEKLYGRQSIQLKAFSRQLNATTIP
jgi:serine/threonine protein kinase